MDPRVVVPEMVKIGKEFYDMGNLNAAMEMYKEAMDSLIQFENDKVPVYSSTRMKYKKSTTQNTLEGMSEAKLQSFKTSVSLCDREKYGCGRLEHREILMDPRKTNFLDEPFTIDSTHRNNNHYSTKSLASILQFNMALVEYNSGFLSTSAQLFAAAIVSYKEDSKQGSFPSLSNTFFPAAASNNLGFLHFQNGLLNNAVESFFDAFRFGRNALRQMNDLQEIIILKNKLVSVVHNVAVTFNFLGESYQKDEEVVQAMRIFKMANDTRKLFKCFSGNDQLPAVYLITLYNVGTTHYGLGNYVEAMHAFNLLLTSRGELYSYDENRVILSMMVSMGKMALEIGDLSKALAFFNEVVSIVDTMSTKVFNENVSQAFHHIGRIHSSRGEYSDAIESLSRALEIETACLGSDHPDLLLTLMEIGYIHHKCGRLNFALETFKEGLRIAKESIGEEHQIKEILSLIGSVCLEGGKHDEAAEAFAQASHFSSGEYVEDDNFCDLTIRAIPSIMLLYPQGAVAA